MGCSHHKAIIILDLERFVKEGLRIFVTTRDFRVPTQTKFPLNMLMASIDPVPLWHFELPDHIGEEEAPGPIKEEEEVEELVEEGPPRCRLCGFIVTDEPLTCPECTRPRQKALC